jgi:hypothetical protein
MDRVMKVGISLFVIVLVVFTSWILYDAYVESSFRASLQSTYTYTLSVTTDTPLYNTTFFIPLPVNPGGTSPVVELVGAGRVSDKPPGWGFTLFGENNATLVKITAPQILPEGPSGFSVEVPSHTFIDTKSPFDRGIVILPIRDLARSECSAISGGKSGASVCYRYLSVMYADYTTTPNAKVLIHTDLQGKNRWHIFRPSSNEYRDTLSLTLLGNMNRGWFPAKGELVTGIGDYDMPIL